MRKQRVSLEALVARRACDRVILTTDTAVKLLPLLELSQGKELNVTR